MQHLLKIAASQRHPTADSRSVALNLFRGDGSFEPLQADLELVRGALAAADCNMLWIEMDSSASTGAVVQGWPRPWRSGTLRLDEIEGEEMVCLFRRMKRPGRDPITPAEPAVATYLDVWIRIAGPARVASEPLTVDLSNRTSDITAGDIPLPPGCRLLSSPEQVVVRIARNLEVGARA